MRLQRALLGLFLLLLLVGLARLSPASAQQGKRAGLIVQLPDSAPLKVCVEFSEETITGFELLQRAGLTIDAEHGPMGAAVCSLNGQGCPASDCFCRKTIYWSYWHLLNGNWAYGAMGASSYKVGDGAVEGWVWGDGKSAPQTITFGEICEGTATATPSVTPSVTSAPPSSTPSATPTGTASPTTAPLAAAATATPSPTPTAGSAPSSTPTPTVTPQANAAVQASATSLPSSTPVQAGVSSAQQAGTSVPSSSPAAPQPSLPAVTPADTPGAVVTSTLAVSGTLGADTALSPTPTLGINQPRRTPVTSTPRPTVTPSSTPAPLPSLAAAPPPKSASGRPPLFGYAVFGVLLAGLGAAALLLRLRR
jgi:hypothetical protein